MKYILILAIILAPNSYASDFSLEIHLASKHFIDAPESLGEFNEQNYGLGFQYQINGKWHAAAGLYQNSLPSHKYACSAGGDICHWEKTTQISHYVSAGRSMIRGAGYDLGLEGGLANGYGSWVSTNGMPRDNNLIQGEYLIMAGGYAAIGGDEYALKIRYMPTVLISAGFQYKF